MLNYITVTPDIILLCNEAIIKQTTDIFHIKTSKTKLTITHKLNPLRKLAIFETSPQKDSYKNEIHYSCFYNILLQYT